MNRSKVFKRAWDLFHKANTGTFGEWLTESRRIEKAECKPETKVAVKKKQIRNVKFFWDNKDEKWLFDLKSKRPVKLINNRMMYGSKVTKKELATAMAV
jgi:hypothetical protein